MQGAKSNVGEHTCVVFLNCFLPNTCACNHAAVHSVVGARVKQLKLL